MVDSATESPFARLDTSLMRSTKESPSSDSNFAGLQANLQADKQVFPQTRKDDYQQSGKEEKMQTRLHANPQTSKPANRQTIKFSTYMQADYKKRLKQLALDKDCDTYEVLQEAIELYFHTIDTKK
jgi:hypothetical protein